MNKKAYSVGLGLALTGLICSVVPSDAGKWRPGRQQHAGSGATNVIMMIPDGMGISDVTAARAFKNGPDGSPLHFETLPVIGYQRTHSAGSMVTDSAAAGTAWATGEKVENGEISCHSAGTTECIETPETILEIAMQMGKTTGLVTSSDITHATPAVFAAHVFSRNCEAEIGRQMVSLGVDVMLGGGIDSNTDDIGCPDADPSDVIAQSSDMGYTLVEDKDALQLAVVEKKEKVLGLFKLKGKTPENFRIDPSIEYPEQEPTLAEMTQAALDILERDPDGFFLMVEGAQIDWANHGNRLGVDDITVDPSAPYSSPNTQLGETLAFDEAVKKVIDWVNADETRKSNTLIIIGADHETGGFMINGPYGSSAQAGVAVEGGWTTHGHTAQDTLIWSQGPGSRYLGRAIDNTEVFDVVLRHMN